MKLHISVSVLVAAGLSTLSVNNLNATVGTTPSAASVAAALDNLPVGAPAELFTARTNINLLTNQPLRDRHLMALAPELNGTVTQNSLYTFEKRLHAVTHRYDVLLGTELVSEEKKEDKAEKTLETTLDKGFWLKIISDRVHQKEHDEFAAYNATMAGFILGLDKSFSDRTRVGLDFSYTSTGSDPVGYKATSEVDIDSYQLDFYTTHHFETLPIYIEGNLATAYNSYVNRRRIHSGGFVRDAKSAFDGWQWGMRAETGYMFGNAKIKITPLLSMLYIHTDINDYDETSGGNFNLHVETDNINLLKGGLGLRVVYKGGQSGHVVLMPEAYIISYYDFIHDTPNFTANFLTTGPSFNVDGLEQKRHSADMGFSLSLYNGHGVNYSMNYNFHYRHDYHAQSGMVRMRYEWA